MRISEKLLNKIGDYSLYKQTKMTQMPKEVYKQVNLE